MGEGFTVSIGTRTEGFEAFTGSAARLRVRRRTSKRQQTKGDEMSFTVVDYLFVRGHIISR